MKPQPNEYAVYYWLDGWGNSIVKVDAIDVQDAIKKVVEPIFKKFGNDKEILIFKVVAKH